MTKDSLHDRGRALEDAFFERKNCELLRQLREQHAGKAQREALSAASGITHHELLDHLLELNIGVETVAALSLVPLVAVGWADRVMDQREREAILQAARESGISEGDPGDQVLQQWFKEPPTADTIDSWKHYVAALRDSLTSGGRETLKEEVLGRAHKVAIATGGILGLGSKISPAERKVLEDLESAFE